MTTPTQPTPAQQQAEAFRAEIRAAFDSQADSIAELRADLETLIEEVKQMRAGLQTAATPPANAGTVTMQATRIERETRKGKTYYKMLGLPYAKHGVTIWEEGLQACNIDPAKLEWKDDAHTFEHVLPVIVQMKDYTNDEGTTSRQPNKVIGKA